MPAAKLDLSNIGGGELMLIADREIIKLCNNIADPNIKTEAVRTINISIKVKPDKNGQTAQVQYAVKSSLPGPDASVTNAYIAMAPGTTDISLFSMDVRQQDLFKPEPLVSEIKATTKPTTKLAEPMPPATFAPSQKSS
jgi:hypothetical protein